MEIRKAAVIGMDGRTSAIKELLEKSPRISEPVLVASKGKGLDAVEEAVIAVKDFRPDLVVIGPEEPLAAGLVDRIQGELGIPCIGPSQELAKLESSKSFTRKLVRKYGVGGDLDFTVFASLNGIEDDLRRRNGFVIKPDGLTGGKGVKVSDVHLHSIPEAVAYCAELLQVPGSTVVIEEKLDGEEFSLQSFCDGTNVVDMVVVQDHKRAYDGDEGPNTGGMGSYSCADHSLPFLDQTMIAAASEINRRVAQALFAETGQKYKGILFGGFMATKDGVKLLEYNARFGDPEALNVLSILEDDLCDVFEAIIEERLSEVSFADLATVCKYVVPERYPNASPRTEIDLNELFAQRSDQLKVFLSAVEKDQRTGIYYATGSRAVACVGIGTTLKEAECIAEHAAGLVQGPFRHRRDIGTQTLIARRKAHMDQVRPAGQGLVGARAS